MNLNFKKYAGNPEQAFVLIFDLEGFSKFFSQPDVSYYVAKYLNKTFEAIDILINGGEAYWIPVEERDQAGKIEPFEQPAHIKFVGDGALYIWTYKPEEEESFQEKLTGFINHLFNFRLHYDQFIESCSDEVPVIDIPQNIRFGMAAGSVYKLSYQKGKQSEYIGYCINLASRLQSYCRDLGFIASARIGTKKEELEEHRYTKVIAKNLRGLPGEIVIVDKTGFELLDDEVKEELFEEV